MTMWLCVCCWLSMKTTDDKIHKIRSSFNKTEQHKQHINDGLTTWFCPQTTSRTSTSVTADTTPSRVFSIKTITRRGLVSQLKPSFELVTKYLPSVLWPAHRHAVSIASQHCTVATRAGAGNDQNSVVNLIKIIRLINCWRRLKPRITNWQIILSSSSVNSSCNEVVMQFL